MNNMQITLALLCWLLVPVVNVYMDRNRPKRIYLVVNILRGMGLIAHGIIFFDMQGGYFRWADIIRNTPIITFYITSYWLIFEAGLNYIWGEKLLYYDTVEKDSGWVDGFFAKYPKLHTPAKATALVVCILSILAIYHTA